MLTRETQVVRFAVVWYHGDSNPKIEHENKKNSYISYSMVLTVVVLSVEAFCFERRFTSPRLKHWNIGKRRHLEYSTCSRIITWLPSKTTLTWLCGKFRHVLIQTYLLLATKPNYTRGHVGCPSDTRPLKTNSNANLR